MTNCLHSKATETGIIEEPEYFMISCPHCNGSVQIFKNEIRCTIFRHGILKETGQQMDPHSSKEICDNAFSNGLIRGCGKPFMFNGKEVQVCDYI